MTGPGLRINRKLTRFDLDKRVRVTASVEGKSTVLHGRTCDISEGGLCALISGQLKSGETVTLEITGLEEGTVSVSAVVRHARGFYYGFEFSYMDRKQTASLVKLMTRNGTPKLRSKS
jgi:hypothetical protein